MAKKVKSRTAGAPPQALPSQEPVNASRRSGWAIGAVVATIALSAFWWSHRNQTHSGANAELPSIPDLSGKPAGLRAALTEAQALVAVDRGAISSVAQLGRLYHANNFNREAALCWQFLRKTEPQSARWCYYLADLSWSAGDEEALRASLEQTVRLAPDYAPAWLQWGDLEFKTAHLDAAESAYRRRLALVPGDAYAMLGLARIALQRGQREEGTRQLVELVRRVPAFSSGHNLYAEILSQSGDTQGAAEQRRLGSSVGRFRAADDPWLRELQASCFDVERVIEWGEIDLQTKQGDRGKALFERAVRLAPETPRGYERLGAYYLDAREPAKAIEVLERGSRLPDVSERLFGYLCDAYHALRDPAGELRAAESGLKLKPNASILHNGRGHALVGLKRLDEAIEAYRLAVACAPFAADPVTNLGEVLLRQGHNGEAKAAFLQALKLQPMYPKALVLLASLELDEGELASAAPRVRALFDADPTYPDARALLVELHLKQAMRAIRRNDDDEVERVCREGISLVPDSAELTGLLGSFYGQQARYPEAVRMLEIAHTLRPDDPRVTISLGDVCARMGRLDDARRFLEDGGRQARKIGETDLADRSDEMLRNLSAR